MLIILSILPCPGNVKVKTSYLSLDLFRHLSLLSSQPRNIFFYYHFITFIYECYHTKSHSNAKEKQTFRP